MVCCGPIAAEPDPDSETSPCLIVEVLSPRTADTDDGEKCSNYQTLASLQDYLLRDPDTGEGTLYRRGGAFWTRVRLGRGGALELASVGLSCDLDWLVGG